ncbi:glycosyltransferase family 2 protein [Candidatus Uhrbacteria bacterium]|nr:glycosyltransferase family 2 protein [Candidatus Uhrbacteria bacterium]
MLLHYQVDTNTKQQTAYQYGDSRFWEMVPGLLVWGTLLFALGLSVLRPLWAIVFVVVFDLYWLIRVLYFSVFLWVSYRRYREATATLWGEKLRSLPRAAALHHLIFLPTVEEDVSILRKTLRALAASSFPAKRMIVVLAGEEKFQTEFRARADHMQREFGSRFAAVLATVHPRGLPGEIPGKGSNLHWVGLQMEQWLREHLPTVADEDLIVSAFDVDTVVHPEYFSYLSWLYATASRPERSSYQPVALYGNNIWTAPAPVRVAAFGTSFWLMGEMSRPERLWTFSSHSMPWKMVRDIRFWQKDIVSEDSRIFLQGFIHYHGDFRVTPMYLPVSMDAVSGASYTDSLRNLYKQLRRWAWGVEHLPVMVREFSRDRQMPFWKKIRSVFNHIEGMYTWATAPILIFVLGWLPLQLADPSEVLVQVSPTTLAIVMRAATAGILLTGVLAFRLLPPRPGTVPRRTWLFMGLQWLMLPVTFVVFGSLPAIDAQTRLMIGRYLGFNVTEKKALGARR